VAEFVRREKFYRRFTNSCTGKCQGLSFPFWIGYDCDFPNVAAVTDEKVEIVPIYAALPAFKIFEQRKQARFRSTVDLTREFLLSGSEFGLLQDAVDSQHVDVVRFGLNLQRHVVFLPYGEILGRVRIIGTRRAFSHKPKVQCWEPSSFRKVTQS